MLQFLQHGIDRFTSPPNEVMLLIFIARKIHCFRPRSEWVRLEVSLVTDVV
jgi:hypothetical protein